MRLLTHAAIEFSFRYLPNNSMSLENSLMLFVSAFSSPLTLENDLNPQIAIPIVAVAVYPLAMLPDMDGVCWASTAALLSPNTLSDDSEIFE